MADLMTTPVHCDVSIVMLAHNGIDFTRRALESILGAATLPAEYFLIDNCSDDATPDLVAEFRPRFEAAGIRFTSWRNSENKGCSLARNEAWEKATQPYTVFMDNDAAVCSRDWLARFLRRFQERPNLAILGPKIIYPYKPHKIQCAGVGISRLGRIAFRGRGADRDDPRYQDYWPCWSLISACWLMKSSQRDDIGMLDEQFHPVQY